MLRSRRRLRAPSLSRSHPAPVPSVSPAENLTDTSPFRLPARVFEPSLRTLRATLLQLHQPGCPRDGKGAAHSNRKLPLYLSRRSSSTAVARDDLPPTATRRAVSRAPCCADDLSGAVSRLRISSLDASDLRLPRDQTMSSTCGLRTVTRSLRRASSDSSDGCPPDPVALPASSSSPSFPEQPSPLGDKSMRDHSRLDRYGDEIVCTVARTTHPASAVTLWSPT